MKVKKVKPSTERQLLVGMIISDNFLKRIIPILDYKYFDIPQTRIIVEWVVSYFSKYSVAPKADIEDIFHTKAKQLNKGDRDWIETFLDSLNKEYIKKGFNESYIYNKTLEFFKRQKLRRNIKTIDKLLEKDRVEEAERVWVESRTIPGDFDMGFSPTDQHIVAEMFKAEEQRVQAEIGIPSLDRMVGKVKSGWSVMLLGPQKRGKTWTMQHIAVAGVLQGFNVVYITGEGEEADHAYRFWMNIGSLTKEEGKIKFPYFDKKKEVVKYKKITRPGITRKSVYKAIKTFNSIAGGRLIVKVFPMGGFGHKEIDQYLDALEAYAGFTPEIILVDYLGIMSAPTHERKEKYNHNAMGMTSLAQNRKAIVYYGHQGKRETLDALNIGLKDVPEDIRVLGHCDVLITILQTEIEKDMGVMRYALAIHRHKKFTSKFQTKILQQLSAGQVVLDDTRIRRPELEDFDSEDPEDDYKEFLP